MVDQNQGEEKLESDRLLELETENTRLQRLVAELLIKNQRLRDSLCRVVTHLESTEISAFDQLDWQDQ